MPLTSWTGPETATAPVCGQVGPQPPAWLCSPAGGPRALGPPPSPRVTPPHHGPEAGLSLRVADSARLADSQGTPRGRWGPPVTPGSRWNRSAEVQTGRSGGGDGGGGGSRAGMGTRAGPGTGVGTVRSRQTAVGRATGGWGGSGHGQGPSALRAPAAPGSLEGQGFGGRCCPREATSRGRSGRGLRLGSSQWPLAGCSPSVAGHKGDMGEGAPQAHPFLNPTARQGGEGVAQAPALPQCAERPRRTGSLPSAHCGSPRPCPGRPSLQVPGRAGVPPEPTRALTWPGTLGAAQPGALSRGATGVGGGLQKRTSRRWPCPLLREASSFSRVTRES